jgi:hypothetical protein
VWSGYGSGTVARPETSVWETRERERADDCGFGPVCITVTKVAFTFIYNGVSSAVYIG